MANGKGIWGLGGDSLCAPEDTMSAYWAAIGAGAHGLAISVQMSADGRLVCCRRATLRDTGNDPRAIHTLPAETIRSLDAGARFRSTVLDKHLQPTKDRGDDTPWDRTHQPHVYHPELDEVFLALGRRTRFLLQPLMPENPGDDYRDAMTKEILATLRRFGVSSSVMLVGDRPLLEHIRSRDRQCLLALFGGGQSLTSLAREARLIRADYLIVQAEALITKGILRSAAVAALKGIHCLIASETMPFCITPLVYEALVAQPWVDGVVCRSVDNAGMLGCPLTEILTEDFSGATIDHRYWRLGYSKTNQDTKIFQSDGLHIVIKAGGEYSGAAALTAFAVHGEFDARVDFLVENPQQGTTFELAAIQVDPGYHHPSNQDLTRDAVNLTFDVHGGPPYASSERDEDDGFRIGWNNGPAVAEFVQHTAQSSNIYNKYGRDVGDGSKDNPRGTLRLVRRGAVFNAHYMDRHNRSWVLCGTALVPTLCADIYIRLGAKHWRKRGRTPPANAVHFTHFRLLQPPTLIDRV